MRKEIDVESALIILVVALIIVSTALLSAQAVSMFECRNAGYDSGRITLETPLIECQTITYQNLIEQRSYNGLE